MSTPSVLIDHSLIPAGDYRMALDNASLSPDAQVYPWRDLYPLAGQTVYWEGSLWIVGNEEHPPTDISCIQLAEVGTDQVGVAARYELRPVGWTQHDEDWLGRE